jgi:UDP-GlcNAc:undecaprenyl-phosphate GlcNAc-1-phosphate transferase
MTSNLYFGVLLLSALLSGLLVKLLTSFAHRHQVFLPPIRPRDVHKIPVPRVGGIAIVTSFIVVTLLIAFIFPEKLFFSGQKVLGLDRNLLGLLLAILLLFAVNVFDDYRGVRWQIRLFAQILAALIVFFFGIKIEWLTNPFGDKIILEGFAWLFIVVWLVGLANVVNMLDGVDGLAGSVSSISLLILFFLSTRPDVAQDSNALLSMIALGSVIGFLPFNLVSAKAFLGDSGSVFIGFIIGVIAVISGGKVATAFLVLAIPFIDALSVVVTRLLTGRSPFLADQLHLHHRLLELGLKPYQITLLFSAVSLAFGLVALNTQTLGKLQAALVALLLVVTIILASALARRLKNAKTLYSNKVDD